MSSQTVKLATKDTQLFGQTVAVLGGNVMIGTHGVTELPVEVAINMVGNPSFRPYSQEDANILIAFRERATIMAAGRPYDPGEEVKVFAIELAAQSITAPDGMPVRFDLGGWAIVGKNTAYRLRKGVPALRIYQDDIEIDPPAPPEPVELPVIPQPYQQQPVQGPQPYQTAAQILAQQGLLKPPPMPPAPEKPPVNAGFPSVQQTAAATAPGTLGGMVEAAPGAINSGLPPEAVNPILDKNTLDYYSQTAQEQSVPAAFLDPTIPLEQIPGAIEAPSFTDPLESPYVTVEPVQAFPDSSVSGE